MKHIRYAFALWFLFNFSAFADFNYVSFDCHTLPEPFASSEEARKNLDRWANFMFMEEGTYASMTIPKIGSDSNSKEAPSKTKTTEEMEEKKEVTPPIYCSVNNNRKLGIESKFTTERLVQFKRLDNSLEVSFSIVVFAYHFKKKTWYELKDEKIQKLQAFLQEQLNKSGHNIGVNFNIRVSACHPDKLDACPDFYKSFVVQVRKPMDPYWIESGSYNIGGLWGVDRAHAFYQEKKDPAELIVGNRGTSAVLGSDDGSSTWLHEMTHFVFLNPDAYKDKSALGVLEWSQSNKYFKNFTAADSKNTPNPLEIAVFLWRLGYDAPQWESYVPGLKK